MKITHIIERSLFLVTTLAVFASCSSLFINSKMQDGFQTIAEPVFAPVSLSETTQPSIKNFTLDKNLPLAFDLPDGLLDISSKNAHSIENVGTILPEFPDYLDISSDGSVGARADLTGIEVLDLDTGKILSQIPVELPNCDYGTQRYFQLNHDGTFLAVATENEIQVWQVGGGLVHTSAYSKQYPNSSACGGEIPQLALSQDGRLLAVKSVAVGRTSAQEYFRIIDVLNNEVLYDWDGSPDALHGDLVGFPALGFSADGKILQTFDASRFFPDSGIAHESFRFWELVEYKELDRHSPQVKTAFLLGETLFALQGDESLKIISRISGAVQANINDSGCSMNFPCALHYSPQGLFALALDFSSNPLTFRGDLIGTRIAVWDLNTNSKIVDQDVLLRNLDGVHVTDEGLLSIVPADLTTGSTWWAPANNFAGMINTPNVGITFSPYNVGALNDSECYHCGTCFLSGRAFNCQSVFFDQSGQALELQLHDGHWQFYLDSADPGSSHLPIELPASLITNSQVRFLGLVENSPVLFYCLDQETRQQSCLIINTENGSVLEEHEDIYSLRFSSDGSQAAFIDRGQKALFLLDLQTQKQRCVTAYQARAADVNPIFLSDTLDLVYLVQNQNNKNIFSLDWVNAADGKVKRRIALTGVSFLQPSVLAVVGNDLIAIGEKNGQIHLFDLRGEWIHSWQAHSYSMVGLIYDAHEKTIISMDENGIIRFWGVQ